MTDSHPAPLRRARRPRLRREIGVVALTLYGTGNIVGAGIYMLIGKAAGDAGYLTVAAFLLAGLAAFCSALSYAELASRYPSSAGVAVYAYQAFRSRALSTAVGLSIVLAGIISSGALLKGSAGYLQILVGAPSWLIMLVLAAALLTIVLAGIKESVATMALLSLIEIGGLVFFIIAALTADPTIPANFARGLSADIAAFTPAAFAGIISAAFIAFYAFIGFEDMVNIAEEVKRPATAYPRAILASLIIVAILYLSVAMTALGILSPSQLGASSAPLAEAFTAATGVRADLLVAISVIAAVGGIGVNIIMSSRFLYGLGHRGWISPFFSRLSRRSVPYVGALIAATASYTLGVFFPIENLAAATSYLMLAVFAFVNISLITVRRRVVKEEFKRISPRFIPWLGAVVSISLLAAEILT